MSIPSERAWELAEFYIQNCIQLLLPTVGGHDTHNILLYSTQGKMLSQQSLSLAAFIVTVESQVLLSFELFAVV
jgi:hypothetical protein